MLRTFAMLSTLVLVSCSTALTAQKDAAGRVALVAGGGSATGGAPATEAKLTAPFGVAFDRAGTMWMVELTGGRLLQVDRKGMLTVLGGGEEKAFAGDGGPVKAAKFNGPHSLIIHPDGDVYLADTWNNRVRKVDPKTGIIATVVGTGEKGFSGDGGPGTQAKFGGIYSVAFGPGAEELYMADLDNRRVRKFNLKSGVVTTVAGNGERGVPADGADARTSPLVDPRAAAVDAQGNVYILERSGNALRVVDRGGKIRTVVGTGEKGFSGDGGPALQAKLNGPKHLCVDREGSVVIADTENHVIRRYLPREGRIVRVAGSGTRGTAGAAGPPDQLQLNQPHGVTIGPAGELIIVDSSNNRVLKLAR